jgi:hypothetical protein
VARLVRPPPGFHRVELVTQVVGRGETFGRIHWARHPDSLAVGRSPSRFSDPRTRRPEEDRFGTLYLGRTLRVCFVEAVLRDLRNGAIGDFPIGETELAARVYAAVAVESPLALVDLQDHGRVRMGIPSEVVGAADQRTARLWAAAFHAHPAEPDGIVYRSRLTAETNLAVFDRAIPKLRVASVSPLLETPGFDRVLDELLVAIV